MRSAENYETTSALTALARWHNKRSWRSREEDIWEELSDSKHTGAMAADEENTRVWPHWGEDSTLTVKLLHKPKYISFLRQIQMCLWVIEPCNHGLLQHPEYSSFITLCILLNSKACFINNKMCVWGRE